jgi:hypothetical protein
MVGIDIRLVGEQCCLPENQQECGQPMEQALLHGAIVVRRSWLSIAVTGFLWRACRTVPSLLQYFIVVSTG